MKVVEEFGKTVDEARDKALRALGLSDSDTDRVDIEVLDPGSPGTSTGWGRKFARIKVTLHQDDEPETEPEVAAAVEPQVVAEDEAEPEVEAEDVEDEEELDEEEDEDDEEFLEDGETPAEILEDILDLMGLDTADVEEDEVDGQVYLNIVGPDLGILIGKHGQTLEALQFVVNLIVNHHAEERTRVTVDVGGYRQRRERTLRDLASRMARRVADEQNPVSLEPMMANERRIIHMALAENPNVETYSQGEEPMRKVIIAPRK